GACLDAAQLFAVGTIEKDEPDREESEREELEQRRFIGLAFALGPEGAVRDQGHRSEREEEPRAHAARSPSASQRRHAERSDGKVSPALLELAQAHPKDDFAVIVRASSPQGSGHRAERAAAAVGRANGKAGRALSIIGGASARVKGQELLDLAKDPDVAYIAS